MDEVDLYLRKSKITRAREKALTFRAQEDMGRRWAAAEGLRVRHVWKDNLSAWSDVRRPEFDRAFAALAAGDVPGLWCYALDRFSRKGAGAVLPVLDAGRRVVFDYERLDSANPEDRRRIIDKAEEAREFSERLSARVRDTKDVQRREGEWLGAAPYGLRVGKDRKLRHGADWPHVLRIFERTAEGVSGRKLAAELTADKVPTAEGGAWGASSVRRIVANPVYEGWQVVAKSRKHTWPTAFRDEHGERVRVFADGVETAPADLVARARRVSAGHQRGPLGERPGRATHLLTDLLDCAGCGAKMPTMGRSHVCNAHASGKPCPAPASVLRSHVEEYVTRAWFDRLTAADLEDPEDQELLAVVAQRWAALTAPEESEEAQEAVAALKAAEAAFSQLQADRKAGIYSGPGMAKLWPSAVAEAEAELAAAQERAAALSGRRVDVTFLLEPEDARAAWEAADLPLRRDLLRLAIDSVTVTRAPRRGAPWDGPARVTITWAEAVA